MANEVEGWSESIPGTVRIAEAEPRQRVRVAGVVKRLTVFPMEGHESLEVQLFDGTGDAVVVFMGRRGIRGLHLGTRLVVEGMLGENKGRRQMVNPKFEFSK